MKTRCKALLFVLSLLIGPVYAQIYVDDDAPGDPAPFNRQVSDPAEDGSAEYPFDSIQEAIDAAVDGDTIIVAPGHYLSSSPWDYDEINFHGKNIRVVSSAPTDFCVVEETVLCGVVIFDGAETGDCLLQGFKIQNHAHGGILGNSTLARISHCIISGNGPCGATVLKDVRGRIANCLIVDNTTFHDCGILPVVSGCNDLVNCTIANNLSGAYISADVSPPIDHVTIRNCIIWGNQGAQLTYASDRFSQTRIQIEYNLVEDPEITRSTTSGWGASTRSSSGLSTTLEEGPDFVRLGSWEDPPAGGRLTPDTRKVLVEGDYHLRTEGWRWTPEPIHGSHWYFDESTSSAIDAGDPMAGLGEELERAPGDPEGIWGVNHAIDLGAYGGTTQASLAPTRGEPPGIGAVDLQDYWPMTGSNQWVVPDSEGTPCLLYVTGIFTSDARNAYRLSTNRPGDWVKTLQCYYVARTLYMTEDTVTVSSITQPPEHIQAQYPQFLVAGSTVEAPYDPFLKGTPEYRSVLVMRGTLAEVLAGTSMEPGQFLEGAWPDVIALRELDADGAPGEPIAVLARGFGPLMMAGQSIIWATINRTQFGETIYPFPARR